MTSVHLLDGSQFPLKSQLDAMVGYLRPLLERTPS